MTRSHRVLRRRNAGYFTHLRDESAQVLEALDEAIAFGAETGVHVEVVHFKCSGTDVWGKAEAALLGYFGLTKLNVTDARVTAVAAAR